MREIKYRGKRIDNGEWVYGNLIECGLTGKKYIFPCASDANESEKVGEESCLKIFTFEVEPETVGQYTGLHDKNGKEIYEGDIVKRETGCLGDEYDGFTGVVKFVEAAFAIESFDGKDGTLLGDDVAETEILGDIHNNPETIPKQNVLCAGEDGICLFCSKGDDLDADNDHCQYDDQKTEEGCPGFECCEQCRECPSDCEFLGK